MKQGPLTIITFLVAFCSMTYELSLAQLLALTFGQTALRYTTTIGFFLCFLGLGALSAGFLNRWRPLESLFVVEVLLSASGLLFPLWLASRLGAPSQTSFFWAHCAIIMIAYLSGLEIPLLLRSASAAQLPWVLAWDYLGSFFSALCFPLLFYVHWGLIFTVSFSALCNVTVALLLVLQTRGSLWRVLWVSPLLGLASGGMIYEETVRFWLSHGAWRF